MSKAINGIDFAIMILGNKLKSSESIVISAFQSERNDYPELVEDFQKGANLIAEEVLEKYKEKDPDGEKIIRTFFDYDLKFKDISEKLGIEKRKLTIIKDNIIDAIKGNPYMAYKLSLIIALSIGSEKNFDLMELKKYFSDDFISRIMYTKVKIPVCKALKDAIKNQADNIGTIETPIELLDLSTRTTNALKRAGYLTIGDVKFLTTRELLLIRNIGNSCIEELRKCLKDYEVKAKNQIV